MPAGAGGTPGGTPTLPGATALANPRYPFFASFTH
jgi:hypothetical protein